jgi:hypothetical protein
VTGPVESIPQSETIYTLPPPPLSEPTIVVAQAEAEPVAVDKAPAVDAADPQIDAARSAVVKTFAEVQNREQALVRTLSERSAQEQTDEQSPATSPATPIPIDPPVRQDASAYSPPPAPAPKAKEEQLPPAPAIFQKVFGDYAEDVYYPTQVPGARRSGTSPQSLILMGVAALIGVCVAAAVATSNGTLLLLIGGPLAVSLIAIGILMLVGRYPTGRP